MPVDVFIVPNWTEVGWLFRATERANNMEREIEPLMEDLGQQMVAEARRIIQATSSRTAAGLYYTIERTGRGEVELTVGSSWEGYPGDGGDAIGSAAEAETNRWATFAYRLHFGYPGSTSTNFPGTPKPYNPRAGRTPATPFLIPVFTRWTPLFIDMLQNAVIDGVFMHENRRDQFWGAQQDLLRTALNNQF